MKKRYATRAAACLSVLHCDAVVCCDTKALLTLSLWLREPEGASVVQEDGAAEEEDVDDEFDMEDDDYYQGENYGVPTIHVLCMLNGPPCSRSCFLLQQLASPRTCQVWLNRNAMSPVFVQ